MTNEMIQYKDYLSREECGRGIQCVKMTSEREVVSGVTYLLASNDPEVMMLQNKLRDMGGITCLKKQVRCCSNTKIQNTYQGKAGVRHTQTQCDKKAQRKRPKDRLHSIFTNQTLRTESDLTGRAEMD